MSDVAPSFPGSRPVEPAPCAGEDGLPPAPDVGLRGPRPSRIVVLHLDSLCCLPAMNTLFSATGSRIVLVVSSDRFAGVRGFLRQLWHNVSRSGVRFTLALGFDIVALRIAAFFAPAMRLVVGRAAAGDVRCWRTPRELATLVGARFCVVSDINAATALDLMRQLRPDLVVSFHFDQILRRPFFDAVPCPVINVHPALLPSHRGPCPSFWTLVAGDERCGVTAHRIVDESIDSGPILARRGRSRPPIRCMGELDELLFGDGVDVLLGLLAEQPKVVLDPAGEGAAYEPFPDRTAVNRARRRGVRLWRLAQAARLIGGLFGWRRLVGPDVG
jgi:methionyl-tRNA formyltransferase